MDGNGCRRGISSFYNGKSKSFTSLEEASSSSSSIKDIAKAENAYTRKRRNLLAFNHVWENKNRNFPLKSHIGGGISKRPLGSSRSTLALAVAMSNSSSDSISNSSEDSIPRSPTPPPLPPLHPQSRSSKNVSAWRSYSVADLQQCDTTSRTYTYQLWTNPVIPN